MDNKFHTFLFYVYPPPSLIRTLQLKLYNKHSVFFSFSLESICKVREKKIKKKRKIAPAKSADSAPLFFYRNVHYIYTLFAQKKSKFSLIG